MVLDKESNHILMAIFDSNKECRLTWLLSIVFWPSIQINSKAE